MRVIHRIVATIVGLLVVSAAFAQHYPSRPIRLIVPYTVGGGTDLMARILAEQLTQALGVTVIADNKPGAGSIIGTDLVAKARPDGYTIGLIASAHAINPALRTDLPFDSLADFDPVIQVATGPNVLVVNANVPAANIAQLIALLRTRPGYFSFGSAGIGNPTHLAGEIFQRATGTKLIHVPYKGSGQAEIGLAGGEITMLIDSIPAALPFIKSGKTRALAVTGDSRFPLLPNVPTTREAGLNGVDMVTWWGIIAPAGTPGDIVGKLNSTVAAILDKPDVSDQFIKFGAQPTKGVGPAQFKAFIKNEIARYGKLIKTLGIQPVQ